MGCAGIVGGFLIGAVCGVVLFFVRAGGALSGLGFGPGTEGGAQDASLVLLGLSAIGGGLLGVMVAYVIPEQRTPEQDPQAGAGPTRGARWIRTALLLAAFAVVVLLLL